MAIISLVVSTLLIFSIPVINFVLKGGLKSAKKIVPAAEVTVKKVKLERLKPKPKKRLRRPQRRRPTRTSLQAGPRFAMELGVAGLDGVGVELALLQNPGGGGEEEGDVDAKPKIQSPPNFNLPTSVREKEVDASVIISFCVNEGGQVFDLQIVTEEPAGLGMAEAGRQALQSSTFFPAQKDGNPVPFCGLEQPFEVRFDD